jgi:hypothetical protein
MSAPVTIVKTATNDDRERIQTLVFGVLAEYGLRPDLDGTDPRSERH